MVRQEYHIILNKGTFVFASEIMKTYGTSRKSRRTDEKVSEEKR